MASRNFFIIGSGNGLSLDWYKAIKRTIVLYGENPFETVVCKMSWIWFRPMGNCTYATRVAYRVHSQGWNRYYSKILRYRLYLECLTKGRWCWLQCFANALGSDKLAIGGVNILLIYDLLLRLPTSRGPSQYKNGLFRYGISTTDIRR